jgi:hypothetical protein
MAIINKKLLNDLKKSNKCDQLIGVSLGMCISYNKTYIKIQL